LPTSKRPTEELIKQQSRRLLTLPNRPEDSSEIAIALRRWAKTEYHVRTIVQYLLDTCTFFPAPSAIRDAADMCLAEPPPKFRPPNPKCSVCGGDGHSVVEKDGVSAAAICDCRIIGAEMPPDRDERVSTEPLEIPEVLAALVEAHRFGGGK
jgi:hypothetical protein